jgi:hypothetical protein
MCGRQDRRLEQTAVSVRAPDRHFLEIVAAGVSDHGHARARGESCRQPIEFSLGRSGWNTSVTINPAQRLAFNPEIAADRLVA